MAKLENVKTKERKLRQLPKGKMMVWDTSVESYHDWKHQMQDMLIYDSDTLRLSTLKDQIKGKDNPFINDLLHNVEDLAEAFSVLDTHFGDVRTVLPCLRMKLDKLPSLPNQEEEENKNIQGILNYWKNA